VRACVHALMHNVNPQRVSTIPALLVAWLLLGKLAVLLLPVACCSASSGFSSIGSIQSPTQRGLIKTSDFVCFKPRVFVVLNKEWGDNVAIKDY
jgi:hypothetical protein